jgi:hypothetical protein
MKHLSQIVLMCLIPTLSLATSPDNSGESEKMKTLFQCGVGTETGFNGWRVKGTSHETITYYENDHVELFNHHPSNLSISFEKKIDELVGFSELQLSAEIEEMENCVINMATAYLSSDGKDWVALNTDVRNGATSFNKQMNYLYLKLVANVTFYKEGRFRLNKASVYGDYESVKPDPVTDIHAFGRDSEMKTIETEFFVFSFDKNVNIETQSNSNYEFILSNLQGQVIQRSSYNGSKRFETNVPDGIYYVSILQNDVLIKTKKIVL